MRRQPSACDVHLRLAGRGVRALPARPAQPAAQGLRRRVSLRARRLPGAGLPPRRGRVRRLVAAPTGAGKTVVGEFAVHLALAQGRKCFYTTPIKALSNQKYADLVRQHGAATVGLLTGDSTINSEAQVVVMTTEVLRNMIYAGSATLANLGFVVMDEVHYLADRFRGAVWEEVIIGLAESIQVVALSATVSNAEEFGEWLSEVRGEVAVVVSEHRPVPLFQHVLVGHRLYDLFADRRRAGPRGRRSTRRWSRSRARSPATFATTRAGRVARAAVAGGRSASAAGRTAAPRTAPGTTTGPGGRDRCGPSAGPSWSRCSTTRRCCRRSSSSSPASAATPPYVSCSAPASGSPTTTSRPRSRAILERHVAGLPTPICGRWTTTCSPRRCCAGSPPTMPGMLPDLQGVRRGGLRPRPDQGRVRHRDAGAGHQHAGSERRAGAAGEVQRRDPRRHHAGGVHPAHRPGRPARHRRRGARGGAVAARPGPAGGRRPCLPPDLPAHFVVHADLQHGGQPGRQRRPGTGPDAAGTVVRAVPVRPVGGRHRPYARPEQRRDPGGIRRGGL